jgi:hypothetical protein
MTKLLAPDMGMKQIDIDGFRLTRQKDGAFHVDGELARRLKSTGDFAVAGMTLRKVEAEGHWCPRCKFMAMFATCGRCGSQDTILESEMA